MKFLFTLFAIFSSGIGFAQEDSTDMMILGRETVLSEVVIRKDLDVVSFLQRVKNDSSFYKAFRNLRILEYSAINHIQMRDKKGRVQASLESKTRQIREGNCRSMQVIDEKITGDLYDGDEFI